jgi:hypothetical protein
MRKKIVGSAVATSLICAGCAPIRSELEYPNGYTGYLLDRHTFDVSRSKDLQLLRAAVILAMASRMATATVRDGRDADAFADYLAAATDELNYAAADIYPVGPASPCGTAQDPPGVNCAGYYQNFESELPLLEGRIINVMLAALPKERARQFLADINKGNVLGAALAAIRTVYQTTVGLDRSAGVYRTGLELISSNVKCVGDHQFDPKVATTWDAIDCLGLSHDKLQHSSYSLAEQSPDPAVREIPLRALLLIAQTSCARLPMTTTGTLADQIKRRNDSCKQIVFAPKSRPTSVQ